MSLIVVPNVVFGDQMILNNSKPERRHVEVVRLGFSYDDPPGEVHEVLLDVARGTPGVLDEPPPRVRTVSYDDSSIGYAVRLHMDSYDVMPEIRSRFLTRIWYAAERQGLTIPFPIRTLHQHDASAVAAQAARRDFAQRAQALGSLSVPPDEVAVVDDRCSLERYTAGEVLLHEGARSRGLCLILDGTAYASVRTGEERRTVLTLDPGEFYGERAMGSRGNLLTVTAETDVTVVVVPADVARSLVRRSARFASDVEGVIRSRRELVARAEATAEPPA